MWDQYAFIIMEEYYT